MTHVPSRQPETVTAEGPAQVGGEAGKHRLSVLDWMAISLLALGGVCVGTGLLPTAQADATVRRILPILLFLATVLVLAELTAMAGLFDAIATRLATLGRGRFAAIGSPIDPNPINPASMVMLDSWLKFRCRIVASA